MQISQLLDSSYKCTADFNALMHLVSKTNVEVPWREAEKKQWGFSNHCSVLLHRKNLCNRKYKDYVYGGCKYKSIWKNKEYLNGKTEQWSDVSRHI